MRPHGPGRASNDRGSLTLSYVIVVPLLFAALLVIVQAACYGLVSQAIARCLDDDQQRGEQQRDDDHIGERE